MLTRRFTLVSALIFTSFIATAPLAAERKTFDAASFASAQSAGKTILVEITAPWCSTCAKQKPIISSIEAKPDFKNLAIFTIDFDSQKDAVKALRANVQSTLISFKGKEEKARSAGVTNPAAIETLMRAAL